MKEQREIVPMLERGKGHREANFTRTGSRLDVFSAGRNGRGGVRQLRANMSRERSAGTQRGG